MIQLGLIPDDEASLHFARQLECFGWTFRGADRVLSFSGRVRSGPGGRLHLVSFLAGCSWIPAGSGQEEHISTMSEALHTHGWLPCGESTWWRQDHGEPFTLVIWSTAVGVDAALHVAASYGDDAVLAREHWWPRIVRAARPRSVDPGTDLPSEATARPTTGDAASLSHLVRERRGLYALTGAGISMPSGVPTLSGQRSLDALFPLYEPFPGSALTWLLDRPYDLAAHFGEMQRRFVAAEPTMAHRALAALERAGVLTAVVTTNHDRLHHLAGSRRVLTPTAFLAELPDIARASSPGLLVVGVSGDEHGVVAAARRHGLAIAVIDPRVPAFGGDVDLVIPAEADGLLTALADELLCPRERGPDSAE